MARRTAGTTAAPTKKTRAKAAKPEAADEVELDLEDLEPDEIEDDVEETEPEPAPRRKKAKVAAKAPVAKKTKKVIEPEPEEDDELEELDEDDEDEPEEKPAKKKAAPKARKIEFGSKELAAYITEKTDKEVTAYQLRDLIRKMARKGEFEREVGEDRSRYEWTGPKDPAVRAILKAVQGGALEKSKAGNLENLKKAREVRAANSKKAKSKKVEEVEEIEDEDLEDDDLELDDDE